MSQQFGRAEMDPLAQGIAHLEHPHDPVGKTLDHGNLESEPEIPDFAAERFAVIEQAFGARGQRMQALQQRRRRPRLAKLLDRSSRCRKRIARKIDAVEIAKILAAVLKVIVDLQAGA
jgi:hypothetical protein